MERNILPLYKFLVYLEDFGSLEAASVDFIDKKSVRGVLGKMEAMNLIVKSGKAVSLSESGYNLLNSILDILHRPTLHWDGKWRVVYFSTPEEIRAKRDKFRRDIEASGFRPIIKGLWASPVDKEDAFKKIALENGMSGLSLFIETSNISGITREQVEKAWRLDRTREQLEGFIKEAESFISGKERKKIVAKELIFYFATILGSGPTLPIEFLPKDWPEYRARLVYRKLRNIVNS